MGQQDRDDLAIELSRSDRRILSQALVAISAVGLYAVIIYLIVVENGRSHWLTGAELTASIIGGTLFVLLVGGIAAAGGISRIIVGGIEFRLNEAESDLSRPYSSVGVRTVDDGESITPDEAALPRTQSEAFELTESRAKERVRPAWDVARGTLERYWERNLAQNRLIFILSVIAIASGFATILYGVVIGLNPGGLNSAKLAAAGGAITQFIGATLLFLYRSNTAQAAVYTRTLERINAVGMGWFFLDTLPERTESERRLKSRAQADAVRAIIGGSVTRSDVATEGGTDAGEVDASDGLKSSGQ